MATLPSTPALPKIAITTCQQPFCYSIRTHTIPVIQSHLPTLDPLPPAALHVLLATGTAGNPFPPTFSSAQTVSSFPSPRRPAVETAGDGLQRTSPPLPPLPTIGIGFSGHFVLFVLRCFFGWLGVLERGIWGGFEVR